MQNNLSKIEIALSSPAFWSIVLLAVYNILALIVPQLTGHLQDVVNIILMVLTAYLHPTEVQKAGDIQQTLQSGYIL